jgi:hypothetical protein
MKKLLLILICTIGLRAFAQGTFAPANLKPFIGKTLIRDNQVAPLKGFVSRGGSLLSTINDPDRISASIYSKGTTVVVLFEQSFTETQFAILDAIEIKNVLPKQEVKVGDCSDGESDNSGIIALVNQTEQERWKAVKAWYFNKDKIRIEPWSAQKVTCWGMVGDD